MNSFLKKKGEIYENPEGKLIFVCCICDAINLSLEDVENHLKSHISIIIKDIDTCSTAVGTDTCNNPALNCNLQQIQNSNIELEPRIGEHVKSKLKNNFKITSHLKVRCTQCPDRFPCAGLRNQHRAEKHFSNRAPFCCTVCSRNYFNERKYMRHMDSHRKTNHIDCPACGQVMKTMNDLANHIDGKDESLIQSTTAQVKHTVNPPPPVTGKPLRDPKSIPLRPCYECDFCGRIMYNRSNLRSHLFTHLAEKPFKCHICGNGFSQSNPLKLHLNRHQSIKPYGCTQCTKTFCSGADLQTHIRSHTGEKKYICSFCGWAFSTSSNLSKHERSVHYHEKNYTCEYEGCGKTFFSRRSYVFHRRIHTGEKPLACHLCDERYSLPKSLKRHIRRAHKDIV